MSVFSKSRLFPHPVRGCATARRLWRLKKASFRSTDVQEIRASSLAGIDQLRRAGMNVDVPEELGAALRKRQKQATPDKGG